MEIGNYRQCIRCVMDTTDPEITFNESGYCNHCIEFLDKRAKYSYQGKKSDEKFDKQIEAIKRAGRNKKYDCIIGVSGGADSSYTLYIAKQKGLRVLAVHMDNGWNSKEAVLNIKNVVSKLGIDYESYVLDWEEMKDLQLAFLKASVPEVETPTDIAIIVACHHFAVKYGVKYIISGGNMATEGILPKSWHYNAKDLKYFHYIHKTFGQKPLKSFQTFGFLREMYYKLVKGISVIYLLNYVPYEPEKVKQLLVEKLDWKSYGGKHHESRFTKFIQAYYLFEKFGIDYRKATLSTQICVGKINRADTEQLKDKPYDSEHIDEEKQYISKKLGISKDEFERILNLPRKWYWDYPNDDKKLGFIYDTYRKLFKKDKLGSF